MRQNPETEHGRDYLVVGAPLLFAKESAFLVHIEQRENLGSQRRHTSAGEFCAEHAKISVHILPGRSPVSTRIPTQDAQALAKTPTVFRKSCATGVRFKTPPHSVLEMEPWRFSSDKASSLFTGSLNRGFIPLETKKHRHSANPLAALF